MQLKGLRLPGRTEARRPSGSRTVTAHGNLDCMLPVNPGPSPAGLREALQPNGAAENGGKQGLDLHRAAVTAAVIRKKAKEGAAAEAWAIAEIQ